MEENLNMLGRSLVERVEGTVDQMDRQYLYDALGQLWHPDGRCSTWVARSFLQTVRAGVDDDRAQALLDLAARLVWDNKVDDTVEVLRAVEARLDLVDRQLV